MYKHNTKKYVDIYKALNEEQLYDVIENLSDRIYAALEVTQSASIEVYLDPTLKVKMLVENVENNKQKLN